MTESYNGELGAIYSKESTVFKVWSPLADVIKVNLYKSCIAEQSYQTTDLFKDEYGVWQAEIQGDLDGVYYTYVVTFGWQTIETIDIYAKAGGVNGERGMVIDLSRTNPKGWENTDYVKLDRPTDAVLYELHVRDFSMDQSVPFKNKGKFLAFTEKGLVDKNGNSVGIDHIAEMGVTHVHLLPIFDFKTVDESSDEPQFNWGYDPQNFNFPEGSYSKNAYDGALRVHELKQLVMALHNEGIGVIMDVVYNHTANTRSSAFSKIYPRYYYRFDDMEYSNASGCGNELATEKPMVRKFIVDSLCYWAKEYKIDGFRFDLLGVYDIETVNIISDRLSEINPNVILYGEGWTGGNSPLPASWRALKYNARLMPRVAFFSDDFRDLVKGNVFTNISGGFVNGGDMNRANLKRAILGGEGYEGNEAKSWSKGPYQVVNYVEAHDNLTLWDKLSYTSEQKSEQDRVKMDKLAAAVTFLSRGIPFIQAGQEFLRSKPCEDGDGFDHNSYRSSDKVNSIKWQRKSEHKDVVDYYKGLIKLRREYDEFRNCDAEVKLIPNLHDKLLGMEIADKFIVLFNSDEDAHFVPLDGEFEILADVYSVGTIPTGEVKDGYAIHGISAAVLVRK